MMTKRDFEQVADAVKDCVDACPEQDIVFATLIAKLCDVFLKSNPAFNADRFIRECTK